MLPPMDLILRVAPSGSSIFDTTAETQYFNPFNRLTKLCKTFNRIVMPTSRVALANFDAFLKSSTFLLKKIMFGLLDGLRGYPNASAYIYLILFQFFGRNKIVRDRRSLFVCYLLIYICFHMSGNVYFVAHTSNDCCQLRSLRRMKEP